MAAVGDVIHILHFNDVRDVEPKKHEPVGGAARFKTMIEKHRHLHPLVFFSGNAFDCGEQVVPILNSFGVNAAVYGNHDFDFGEDALEDLAAKCNFPWLMSNAFDRSTGDPLGKGKTKLMLEHAGKKIGVVGLVEEQWIATMSAMDGGEVFFEDYVAQGQQLALELRDEGADLVIALTHMQWPNDTRLAAECRGIDLYLGGHDDDMSVQKINGRWVIKNRGDFRELSLLTLTFNAENGNVDVDVSKFEVTSDIPEDPELQAAIDRYRDSALERLEQVVGHVGVELDGRFSSSRSRETNLGNLICDVAMAAMHADCVLLNSGSLRSDRVHPVGPIQLEDVKTMVPSGDRLLVVRCSGTTLLAALEHGVSRHPNLDGRFAQVAGIRFAFEPASPEGHRIDSRWVFVHDEPLDLDREYQLCVNSYMTRGGDGYTMFAGCPLIVDEQLGPTLENAVLNHFRSVDVILGKTPGRSRHRQRVLAAATAAAVARQFNLSSEDLKANDTETGTPQHPNLPAYRDAISRLEQQICSISPKVEGRIQEVRSDADIREHTSAEGPSATVG